MNDQPKKRPAEPKDEADATYLFGESIGPEPTEDGPTVEHVHDQGYEVEDLDEDLKAPVPPVPVAPSAPSPRKKPERVEREPEEADDPGPKPKPRPKAKRSEAEESPVSEPWSRGAEWGSTLLVVAVSLIVTFGLLYATFSPTSIGLMVLILVGGLAVTLALAYPIFITLERPVRMTPEQALKDFYGALSHKRPHYKRMWLLLSDRGKTTGPFDGFGAFQTYWRKTLTELKSRAPKGAGMLSFSVVDFKSEKSAGQTVIDGTATIHARAGSEEAPVAVYRGKMWFVKGPDRMWYLNQGTLPEPAKDREA